MKTIVRIHLFPSTHPVNEKGLDELDDLQCDQETDGDQVVEQDYEGEEVEAKVSRPAIYQGMSFGQRKWYTGDASVLTCEQELVKRKCPKLLPANEQSYPNPENVFG